MSEYLVIDAVEGLDPAAVDRFTRELQEFVRRQRGMLDAQRRGVAVAPAYRRPFAVQLEDEAERREWLADPTAVAWRSVIESQQIARAFEDVCRGSGVS